MWCDHIKSNFVPKHTIYWLQASGPRKMLHKCLLLASVGNGLFALTGLHRPEWNRGGAPAWDQTQLPLYPIHVWDERVFRFEIIDIIYLTIFSWRTAMKHTLSLNILYILNQFDFWISQCHHSQVINHESWCLHTFIKLLLYSPFHSEYSNPLYH